MLQMPRSLMLFFMFWLSASAMLGAADPTAAPGEPPAADKATGDKPSADKAPSDKTPSDKTPSDKPPADKPAAEGPEIAAPPREQTIYIPFEKLRQTFEKDGRGVFIPYDRFQELWKAARQGQHKPVEVQPSTPAVITEADSEATVGKEVVRVIARLKIDLLASGWVTVPLRLQDAAVISAQLVTEDGKEEPARLAAAGDKGYTLLVENKTKGPRQIVLRLEYAQAFNKMPGRNDVSFAAPQAPVNRWKVRVPETGVKVHIEPMIAATEVGDEAKPAAEAKPATDAKPADSSKPTDDLKPAENTKEPSEKKTSEKEPADKKPADNKPAAETVLLAFVGTAPTVRIEWTAKAEGASGLTALASVDAQELVSVEEVALRTHARLTYSISRAELARLSVDVPVDQKVVEVSAPNVRQWSVETTGNTQKITVQLFEPARASESIDITLEQFTTQSDSAKPEAGKPEAAKPPDAPQAAKPPGGKPDEPAHRVVEVPVVRALDVSRQQGVLVVDAAEGMQIEARTRDGLLQLDAADLPPALAKRRHELSYRYAALPFKLSLDATKIKPRVLASELVRAYLTPEYLTLQLQATYTIERAGIFEMAIDVPAGYDVREVRGEAANGANAAEVDAHHLEGVDKTRLVVNLAHKAIGCVGLFVELQKRLDDANLLSPTGKASEIPLPVPRVAPETLERTSGRLIVHAPESLRVNPAKQSGLRSVSLEEALRPTAPGPNMPVPPVAPVPSTADSAPVESFVYTKAPVELVLSAERRKPSVTVGQLLVARVEPGVVKYEATFFYEIRYSGVKSLRIDLPADLAADVRNNTPGISEKVLDPAPTDLGQGDVAWSLSGDGELLGAHVLRFNWERKLENLEVGKSLELTLPHLRPMNTDRAWGQIILIKAETIDLSTAGTPSGLRPIDPQHDLMPGASLPDAALAFEFQGDWSLQIMATRYQLEVVKHTSIERGLIRAVVTRGGQLAVQALYRMRSARQRLAVELPAGVEFDAEPLRINGRPIALERGANDAFFVPLVGRAGNEPFLLELRYTLSGAGKQVELPTFLDEPAVQKVFVSAFLPDELELLGHQGPWTDEQLQSRDSYSYSARHPGYSDPSLVQWVSEGLTLPSNPANSFPVDGKLFVFSTLRPEAGKPGSLHLSTMNTNWLHAILFLVVFGVGASLLHWPLAQRGALLAGMVSVLVLAGAFFPTFTTQVVFGGLGLALVLTLLLWCIAYLVGLGQPASAAPAFASGAASPLAGATVHPTLDPSLEVPAHDAPLAEDVPHDATSHGEPSHGESPHVEPPPPADEPKQGGDVHE